MLRATLILISSAAIAACALRPRETAEANAGTVWLTPPVTQFADANHDGLVTREEASIDPSLQRAFSKYDANSDGVLDRGEFAQLEDDSHREHGATNHGKPASDESKPPVTLNRTGADQNGPKAE